MNSFEKLQLKVILEKLIVGLEEPILIKSVGKMIAKIDSGNGGYNVIHGENLYYQGDVLTFETSDINGNRKVVSKKVKDTIKINIGGGNIQERPVIELNIKFAGEDYKKIPFSVTDRSTNDQKVLISKDFLVNQLDALIDPSTKDIADKNIDVDYPLNEGMKDNFKNGEKITKGSGFLNGIKNAAKMGTGILKKSHNFIKKWGELSNVDTSFMYQYQDTFTGIANLLKTALGFGKEVPILNQFGVPKNVKSKLSNFDSYIKKYDSTVSSISSAASSFVYKAKGKTNESLIFEDEKTEEAILNVTEATIKKNYESAFLNAVESVESYTAIKKDIDNCIKQIQSNPENIIKLKEELKNKEINLEKTKNEIIEKNYNNDEFIKNAINSFIQVDKDRYIRAFEKKREDVIKIFEELKNNFNKNLSIKIKEIEQNHKTSVNQITNEKILKNRGNFKVYFEADRRYKTEVDSNDYIKEFIFHLLNTHPESFEKIAKEFYASRDINKKWALEEIVELLTPRRRKIKKWHH